MSALDAIWRTALSALQPAGPAAPLSIVIFHRVLSAPDPLFPGDPDVRRFEQICGWLTAWYRVLPLDEAVRRLAGGTLPSRALAITFDDGYADNHDLAMPILRRHGLCATFFIATGYLDGGCMWNDIVIEAVRRTRLPALDLGALHRPGLGRLELGDDALRRKAVSAILDAIKYLPNEARVAAAETVAERAQVVPRRDLMMQPAQVAAMAAAGMQIGAHTVSHPILARLDDAQAERELAQSKDELQSLLARPVTLFAYPNGKPGQDYGRRDVTLARKLGFEAAVSTAYGAACRADQRPFELPRFTPWDRGRWPFALRMARNLSVRAEAA
jgi:peptidoglycan/xylan/chitin deacetylase (PgdA/CDA1 family)